MKLISRTSTSPMSSAWTHVITRAQAALIIEPSKKVPTCRLPSCAGLPDRLIDYLPSLLNQPIQFYSCFISYASKDQIFADRLHADLQNKGVRCWFAPHDMRIGA